MINEAITLLQSTIAWYCAKRNSVIIGVSDSRSPSVCKIMLSSVAAIPDQASSVSLGNQIVAAFGEKTDARELNGNDFIWCVGAIDLLTSSQSRMCTNRQLHYRARVPR